MLTLVVLVETAFCVNIKVATESHPTELVNVTEYVPAVAYELLFQLYGKADGQRLTLVVLAETAFCVKFKVATESHPTELVNVTEYVPVVAYECVFQVYGKADGQTLILVVLVETAFCVSIKVATESHPTELVNVTEYVPAVAYE
jgi:hypothetical protein